MERDGIIGYGTAFLINDQFMWNNDRYPADLCKKCGSFLFTQKVKSENGLEGVYCSYCKS